MINVFHDDLNRVLRETVARVDPNAVSRAFVAGLRSRRLEHWSSLASFALARTLPEHEYAPISNGHSCRICGASSRADVFADDRFVRERTTGTIRTDSLRYTLHDLEAFSSGSQAEPDDDDRDFFDRAIARIARVPSTSGTFAAERALGIVFESRVERKRFLGVLGVCGVLASSARPGFWPAFVPFEDRSGLDASPYFYPVTWWRRADGMSLEALRAFDLARYLSGDSLAALRR